jgi:hypothetical protein
MVDTPRITSRDELRAWLEGKPRPWAQVIAIRAALRVFPTIGRALDAPSLTEKRKDSLVSAIARANFTASAVLLDQNQYTIDAAAAANAAAYAANAAADADAATATAAYAAYAAAAAADDATTYATADAAAAAAATAAATDANADADAAIWQSISDDANWLAASKLGRHSEQAVSLLQQSLWHGNAPKTVRASWRRFVRSRFAAKHGFKPWIQWYEALAVLDGVAPPRFLFSDALTLRIATQQKDWWKRPALKINTDIARWLAEEEFKRKTPDRDPITELTQAINQVPDTLESPEVFDWRDGRLEVLPPKPLSDEDGVAQDYLDEVRDKADRLRDRLHRTNADPAITDAVNKLLGILTQHASNLRPARLDSCADTLRFLVETHNNDTDERELSPVVLAGMMDLSLTTRKLCSCLPMLWKREAAQLAESLPPDPTDTFQNLETVRHTAEECGVLGDSASETLATQSSAVTDQTVDPLRRKEIAKYLLIARDLMLKLLRAGGAKASEMAEALAGLVKEAATAARPKLVQAMSEDMVKAYKLARGAAITGAGSVFVYATDAINHITQLPGFEELAQVVKWLLRLMS